MPSCVHEGICESHSRRTAFDPFETLVSFAAGQSLSASARLRASIDTGLVKWPLKPAARDRARCLLEPRLSRRSIEPP